MLTLYLKPQVAAAAGIIKKNSPVHRHFYREMLTSLQLTLASISHVPRGSRRLRLLLHRQPWVIPELTKPNCAVSLCSVTNGRHCWVRGRNWRARSRVQIQYHHLSSARAAGASWASGRTEAETHSQVLSLSLRPSPYLKVSVSKLLSGFVWKVVSHASHMEAPLCAAAPPVTHSDTDDWKHIETSCWACPQQHCCLRLIKW